MTTRKELEAALSRAVDANLALQVENVRLNFILKAKQRAIENVAGMHKTGATKNCQILADETRKDRRRGYDQHIIAAMWGTNSGRVSTNVSNQTHAEPGAKPRHRPPKKGAKP